MSIDLKGIRLMPDGMEVTSITAGSDGSVLIDGKLSMSAFKGRKQLGRSTTNILASVRGREADIPDLIDTLAIRLMTMAAGYAVGLNQTLAPLAERMAADFENMNRGN